MKLFPAVIMLFISMVTNSQNLVPNGDFENYDALPMDKAEWYHCQDWSNLNEYRGFAYGYGSPDYFHDDGWGIVDLPITGFSWVEAYSGKAIMGFVTKTSNTSNYREYLSAELTSPLLVGANYRLTYYITNGAVFHEGGWSSNHIGVHFSQNKLIQKGDEPLSVVPQLDIKEEAWATLWKEVSYEFMAMQPNKFITIGNFYNDANTSFSFRSTGNGKSASYYFIDNVELIQISEPCEFSLEMPNVFTPNGDGKNDRYVPIEYDCIKEADVMIVNRWGQTVYTSTDLQVGWEGVDNGQECSDGIYYSLINYTTVYGEVGALKGIVTLVR